MAVVLGRQGHVHCGAYGVMDPRLRGGDGEGAGGHPRWSGWCEVRVPRLRGHRLCVGLPVYRLDRLAVL